MRLRTSLFLLVVAIVLPLAAFSLALSAWLLEHQYESYISVIKDRNRAFMTAVDAEVQGHLFTLAAIAESRSLIEGRLERFHGEAAAVLARQPAWLDLILLDRGGRHLVNAYVPWGTALPEKPQQPESVWPVVEQRRPSVGNVIVGGPFQQRAGIPLRVPVVRDGEVAYVLSAILKPEAFDALFEAQRIPHGWVSGLVDANGAFISRIPERPRGSRAGEQFIEEVRKAEEGWFRGRTVDGFETFTAFTVSELTGWSLGFAIPIELVYGPVRRAAWAAGGGLLAVVVLALAIAYWLGRRISRPIAQVAAAAQALGEQERPVKTGTNIREVSELEQALNAASAAILARDRELRRQASELRVADANKSQFLALLSHELRNPLAPLLNGLSILKARTDPETATRTHAMMERQIGQMRRLIDDLLDVSRIDRGKLELHTERIAVDAVIRNAIETAKPNIEAKQHALTVQYAPEPLYVDGDPVRLAQVVSNLLNNAAKFTPPRGRIEISTRSEASQAVVCVRDTGIGFPPEDADRIFDSFVQLDASRNEAAGGLGLGLTLVRSLLEMHGGRVEARSLGEGQGAEFTIRLPLATAPESTAPPAHVKTRARGGRRVLVVDDNTDAADTLADLLRIEGFDVSTAYSGDVALSRAKAFRPDVAFIDLNMPGMSGLDLARALRGDAGMAGLRLVALTGMGQQRDVQSTHAAGFDAHLTKPAPAHEVLRLASAAPETKIVPFGKGAAA